MTQDERWRGPVARGLAQREPGLRAFAMAATLAHPRADLLADPDGCLALGIFAARDNDNFDRVARMYLGPNEEDAFRGAESLAISLEYVPERVCETVRNQWEREVVNPTLSKRRSQGNRLRDVLLPLYKVNHRAAAIVVRSTLDTLLSGIDLQAISLADQLLELIDFIRGRLIPFDEDVALETLLAEIESPDMASRFRAARRTALRRPRHSRTSARSPLCCDPAEDDPDIIARLLQGMFAVLDPPGPC